MGTRNRRPWCFRTRINQSRIQCAARCVGGLSRMAHDLLLRGYLDTEEHDEMAASFAERRKPDASKFGQ